MQVDELYERLVNFGWQFKLENGKIKMKASLVCSNDPRFEDWRRVGVLITDLSSDTKEQLEFKARKRIELSRYVLELSVFSEEKASTLIREAMIEVNNKRLWKGDELEFAKKYHPEIYELTEFYERDFDVCCLEGNMLELYSAVQMWKQTMIMIWEKYNNYQRIMNSPDDDNPFTHDKVIAAAQHQQEVKRKRGKQEPDPNQLDLFSYAQELYKKNGVGE
jgi:hypothetical protein